MSFYERQAAARRASGWLLLAFVLAVALVAGMGLMMSQISNYHGVQSAEEAAQALYLARAGLEDARLKLERDLQFPPRGDGNYMEDTSAGLQEQTLFTYSEDVLVDGASVGSGSGSRTSKLGSSTLSGRAAAGRESTLRRGAAPAGSTPTSQVKPT